MKLSTSGARPWTTLRPFLGASLRFPASILTRAELGYSSALETKCYFVPTFTFSVHIVWYKTETFGLYACSS